MGYEIGLRLEFETRASWNGPSALICLRNRFGCRLFDRLCIMKPWPSDQLRIGDQVGLPLVAASFSMFSWMAVRLAWLLVSYAVVDSFYELVQSVVGGGSGRS